MINLSAYVTFGSMFLRRLNWTRFYIVKCVLVTFLQPSEPQAPHAVAHPEVQKHESPVKPAATIGKKDSPVHKAPKPQQASESTKVPASQKESQEEPVVEILPNSSKPQVFVLFFGTVILIVQGRCYCSNIRNCKP